MAEEPQNPENQRRQEQSRSEASNDLGKALNQQREINQAGADFIPVLQEIAKAQKLAAIAAAEANKNTREAYEYAQQQKAQQRFIADRTKEIVSLSNKLSKFSTEDLKSKAKRNSFESTYNKAVNAQKLLIEEAQDIRKKAKGLTGELKELELDKARALEAQVESTAELLNQAEKLRRSQSALANIQKPFEFIEKLISDLPIVRELFGELTKMSKKIAETYSETASIPTSIGSGLKQLGKGLLQLTLGAFITGLIRGFSKLSDSVARVQTGLALSTKEASRLSGVLTKVKGTAFNLEEMENAAIGFGAALGTSAIAAGSTYKRVALLAERLGISAEQSAKIYSYGTDNINSFERQTDIIAGTNKKLNEQNNISIRLTDIFQDISGASADTAISLGKFPNGLARAAYESRKLGLNLREIKGVQESLLDFTSSITSELNAEALLGKEFNLDRARYYAFTNDIVNLSKELYDISGGIEEFQKMSLIDQRAMAGMLGMSAEQYADMLTKRQALQKVFNDEELDAFSRLKTEEQIAALVKKYTGKDFNMSVDDARAKAIETLFTAEQAQGRKMFDQQRSAIGAMKLLSNTLEELGLKTAQLLSAMFGIKNPIQSLARGIAQLVEKIDDLLLVAGIDLGVKPFGGGTMKASFKIAENAQAALRGVNDLTKTQIEQLKKVATEEVTDKTTKEKLQQIDLAKKSLKAIENLKGVDIDVLGASIMKSGIKIGILTSDSTKKIIQDQRKYAKPLLEDLNFLVKNFNFVTPKPDDGPKYLPLDVETGLQKAGENKDTTVSANDFTISTPPKDTTIPANDFTIRTHPKDTLKIAGGTKFGDETNQLLEKLIDTVNNSETNKLLQVLVDTVKQGGNVYLDRRKVGESLVLGYSSQ